MVLDGTAGKSSFAKVTCCDTGVCTYQNTNFINGPELKYARGDINRGATQVRAEAPHARDALRF